MEQHNAFALATPCEYA